MRGQTLVPFTLPRLRHSLHEVPLQFTDAGVMLEQVLLRLIKLLHESEKVERRRTRCCGGRVENVINGRDHGNDRRMEREGYWE